MTELFLHIVNMSITASILAVVVLLLRLLLKRAPKWVNVLLWGLVAIRLICPFALESPISLIPKTDWIGQEDVLPKDDFGFDSIPEDYISDSIEGALYAIESAAATFYPAAPESEMHKSVNVPFVLSCLWFAGIAVLILYTVISTVRLHRSVDAAIRVRDNVWESSAVDSPFVLGLSRPRIYVPRGMDEDNLAYVIAHEEAHIRRKDHLWKPFGFLLLCIHWFNPVMWLAYVLLCRDIEMACDERVVKEYDEVQRADYSAALLSCSVSRRMISACPLAFGEVGVKRRIKSVLNYKKPAFWVIIIAVVLCIAAAVCFLTNPITLIDYTFDANVADYDTIHNGSMDFEKTEVRVTGKIERNFFGKASFVGKIIIDGQQYDNDVNLSDLTPILSYYTRSRLVSSAYILAHSSDLDKMTIVLLAADEEPRRYVFCNMTYEEAVLMQKVNELPEPKQKTEQFLTGDIIASNIVDETLTYEVLKQHQEEIWAYKNTAVNDTIDETFRKWGERIAAVGVNEARNCVDVYVYDFDVGDISRFQKALGHCSYVLIQKEDQIERIPENKGTLTLEDVITLSAKGQDLTWEDFAGYSHVVTGSGLYIHVYDIDENFELWIGGGAPTGTPMYIRLKLKDVDVYADVTRDDIAAFIEKHTKEGPLLYDRPLSYFVDLAWAEAEPIVLVKGYGMQKSDKIILHDPDGTVTVVFSDSARNDIWSEVHVTLVRQTDGSYAAEPSLTTAQLYR